MAEQNERVVKQHFAFFGQGNLPDALELFAEDVDFQSPVTKNPPEEISWAKPRYSKKDVALFFKELSEKIQVKKMEAMFFTCQNDRVIVEGRNGGVVKATGRGYEHDWVMVFTLQDEKICRARHYYDTADIVAAFRD
ncbi:nuclear transport factor 2 family protein [Dethiobacter alkaliphilus]|uniref:nuclear transport factor 2 family protein n=1 Tax=Dethiobacter alkaliphilus TaxID=427926 RepID=UPI000301DE74|nr:nuclear transport factor 2 family protein [Dethiobacter alkaliphilus]